MASIKFGESVIRMHALANFKFGDHKHFHTVRAIVHEIILVGFKLGKFLQNRQFAKLKTLPKFPAIRYIMGTKDVWHLLHQSPRALAPEG